MLKVRVCETNGAGLSSHILIIAVGRKTIEKPFLQNLKSGINEYFLVHPSASSFVLCELCKFQYGSCSYVEDVLYLQLINETCSMRRISTHPKKGQQLLLSSGRRCLVICRSQSWELSSKIKSHLGLVEGCCSFPRF